MDKFDLFNDINNHLLEDERPSEYLNKLLKDGLLNDYPFTMLSDLNDVKQNLKYHPEGSVWNHTLLVVDEAAKVKHKSRDMRTFMWAALLHDIGKKPTTRLRNGKITSYNHDIVGKGMSEDFLSFFEADSEFKKNTSALVRWHMQPLFTAKDLPFSNIEKMLSEISLSEIALLSLCDRLGRGNMTQEKIEDEKRGINIFIEKCNDVLKKINLRQKQSEKAKIQV